MYHLSKLSSFFCTCLSSLFALQAFIHSHTSTPRDPCIAYNLRSSARGGVVTTQSVKGPLVAPGGGPVNQAGGVVSCSTTHTRYFLFLSAASFPFVHFFTSLPSTATLSPSLSSAHPEPLEVMTINRYYIWRPKRDVVACGENDRQSMEGQQIHPWTMKIHDSSCPVLIE